jgi:hypothetical protein
MEGGEISNNGQPTLAGPYTSDTLYSLTPSSYVILGAGIQVSGATVTMTGGSIINNGTTEAPASGILSAKAPVLNGPVIISGNSINTRVLSAVARYYVQLSPLFENKSDAPIVVDTIVRGASETVANIKTWWGSNPAIRLGFNGIATEEQIAEFAPGVAARITETDSFCIFPDTFTFASDGSFIW